jgi:hypothetical protein
MTRRKRHAHPDAGYVDRLRPAFKLVFWSVLAITLVSLALDLRMR